MRHGATTQQPGFSDGQALDTEHRQADPEAGQAMSNWWTSYNGVKCYRIGEQNYTYQTSYVDLDADGAPNAYGPNNSGLDLSANAGYPDQWENCLAPDPRDPSRPYVQPSGYFVSMTSLEDPTRPKIDPKRYVSATEIPYIVFPGSFFKMLGTGALGDFVMVKNLDNGHVSGAIVADIGPAYATLGEMSLALATALGGHNPNPRNGVGVPVGMMRYVVFPYSHLHPAWPLTAADVRLHAETLLASIGGWATVDANY